MLLLLLLLLGHSREKFTPTHKGFHHFTGMYTWDICPFTKRNYLFPPILGGRNYFDWLRVSKNERPEYYTDSNHATIAITKASTDYIDQHVKYNSSQPLFLYVSYTAGHSPLIPIQEDEEKCKHIKHLWRRQFCGLVVGVDESVERIHAHAKLKLDKNNTIIIFTSDNGGSSWFGGLNYPFRVLRIFLTYLYCITVIIFKGSKNTPYEGGVRVPAFLVDHRNDSLSRSYNKLFHVSDWFPTILSLCAVKYDSSSNLNLDGKDHSIALYNQLEKDVRTEVLIDLRVSNFSTFSKDTFAYIDGKYKLIIGEVEDSSYYLEPIVDRMNIEGLGLRSKILSYVLENVIRAGEFAIGTSEFDSLRIVLTHYFKHIIESYFRLSDLELVQLYNLDEDPKESINLARQYPDIVDAITNKIQHIMHNNKTLIQNPKLQYSLKLWPLTFIKGDCSKNSYIKKNDNCLFTVPWINDTDINPPSEDFEIFLRNKVLSTFMNVIILFSAVSGTIVVIIMSTMWLILHFRKKS